MRAPDWWESPRFQAFAWLQAGSDKTAISRPAHQRVTLAVRRSIQNVNMMNNEPSKTYQTFYDHVFGDYRYFHYNGLSEDMFNLEGSERNKAEKIVLQAIRKISIDERAIRAAGYLKLQEAIPVLEKKLTVPSIIVRQEVRSAIVWALLKIKHDKQQLGKLIEVVNKKAELNGLTRADAVDLIADFGEEPLVVKTLLHAFLEEDLSASASAHYALRKIFQDNQYISDLFKLHGFAPPFHIRDSIVKHIELQMKN